MAEATIPVEVRDLNGEIQLVTTAIVRGIPVALTSIVQLNVCPGEISWRADCHMPNG